MMGRCHSGYPGAGEGGVGAGRAAGRLGAVLRTSGTAGGTVTVPARPRFAPGAGVWQGEGR
jgi:hypothetical protein